MRHIRHALLALACVTSLGAAGLGGATVATATASHVNLGMPLAEGATTGAILTDAEIKKALHRHTKALRNENRKAYLALYAHEKPKLVRRQAKRYENLVKLAFETVAYKLDGRTGEKVDRFGTGVRVTVDIAFVHQITGIDPHPVAQWYRWTMVERPRSGRLEVTRVRPSPGVPRTSAASYYPAYPAPWDAYAHMVAIRRPHVLVLTGKRYADTARKYADAFERAARRSVAVWRKYGPAKATTLSAFVITIERRPRHFRTMYGRSSSGSDKHLAGYSRWLPTYQQLEDSGQDRADSGIGGARVVVDPTSSFFTLPGMRGVRELARHEIAHSLASPMLSGYDFGMENPPLRAWIVEGFAEYMALRDRPVGTGLHFPALRRYVHSGRFDGRLPTDAEVHSQSLLEQNASYQLGYLALRFIAREYGEKEMFRLVARHYQKPFKLDRHIHQLTGLTMREFQRKWRAYVRRTVS